MDVLGWLVWLGAAAIKIVWSIVWFLLGGWVVTLVQLVVIAGGIFAYKFGWRRAPAEMLRWARTFGRFLWGWMRAREPGLATADRGDARIVVRVVRVKERGDINASTLLSLMALLGLGVVACS